MLTQEIIRAKRDGGTLGDDQIAFLIRGLTAGTVTESQAAAFAMAVFFRGMTAAETVALTLAMRDSGSVLSWSGLDGPVVDKHSTGGIGDTVSLMLAPMLAAAGAAVPMISGRGLGHTGGTLDKLDAIPGYRSQPDVALFRRTVREAGCAIIGQTPDLAPADRRLYAIRDVTATVESAPLITASILSKKLAAGLDALVLDVKSGSGAFMADKEAARTLARNLVEVANGAGLRTSALLTDMDEPLASAAGNALEVRAAIDYLTGTRRDARLHAVVLALGAELLVLCGLESGDDDARSRLHRVLDDGSAADRFARMVAGLGGPSDLVESPDTHLPAAALTMAVAPDRAGVVKAIDTRAVGLAVIELGGGRRRAEDGIDPAVGLTRLAGKGEAVSADRPLALVHARDSEDAGRAAAILRQAYVVGNEAVTPAPPVYDRVAAG